MFLSCSPVVTVLDGEDFLSLDFCDCWFCKKDSYFRLRKDANESISRFSRFVPLDNAGVVAESMRESRKLSKPDSCEGSSPVVMMLLLSLLFGSAEARFSSDFSCCFAPILLSKLSKLKCEGAFSLLFEVVSSDADDDDAAQFSPAATPSPSFSSPSSNEAFPSPSLLTLPPPLPSPPLLSEVAVNPPFLFLRFFFFLFLPANPPSLSPLVAPPEVVVPSPELVIVTVPLFTNAPR
mmetsp:Transcript_18592/g.40250  ORF Transcript_18592/g.40250 Transcript_18592/m.40250 type:complete len:236 (+) Transcript_18592:3127-3834(+)